MDIMESIARHKDVYSFVVVCVCVCVPYIFLGVYGHYGIDCTTQRCVRDQPDFVLKYSETCFFFTRTFFLFVYLTQCSVFIDIIESTQSCARD